MPGFSDKFDPRSLVVIGEGLSSGFGDFTLNRYSQRWSFPAQLAARLGINFRQPLLEPPGLGGAPGFETYPAVFPAPYQSTLLEQLPPVDADNLSVPGFTLRDALELRPFQPLISNEEKQTACNLILGAKDIAGGRQQPLATAVERAAARRPGLVIVCLGFTEALTAAVGSDPQSLPETADFIRSMSAVLDAVSSSAVMLLNVPDPLDLPHFSTIDQAAAALRVEQSFLTDAYHINSGDRIKLPALHRIGYDLFAGEMAPLCPTCTLSQAAGASISGRVREWNGKLAALASQKGALLVDLAGYLRGLAGTGVSVGGRTLRTTYLGGFFGLNGYYPGYTGHALIGNQLLLAINAGSGRGIGPIDPSRALAVDPAAACTPAAGRIRTAAELRSLPKRAHRNQHAAPAPAPAPSRRRLDAPPTGVEPLPVPLSLPPGLVQEIAISPDSSFFGDGISALHCQDARDVPWGASGNQLFGGFAMVDSHLTGNLRFRFSPPVNGWSHFELTLGGGLTGDDSVLAAPVFFQMPFRQNRVDDVPGVISSGEVNLTTGSVSRLRVYAQYSSNALRALVSVNPGFPKDPLSFVGTDIADPQREYGSAWARFEQRSDGKLDFIFYGTRYVPLGSGTRWPLNFCSPEGQFATIPAEGTVMHPHLRLSTKAIACTGDVCPPLPRNTVRDFVYHTRNSAFGDAFLLNVPELGGVAKGRSHVMGRLQVQFGLPCRNTLPIAVTSLAPAGIFTPPQATPISESFPGRLTPGPTGFYEMLRFPLRTYALDELAILDDPFDIPMGAVDLATGRVFNEHLHRGFIQQDLIFSLVRIETRTPHSSFYFRGPGGFETKSDGRLVFRYRGEVHIPYPKGLLFPQPNLSTSFVNQADAALDPFLWIRAVEQISAPDLKLSGEGNKILASIGEVFSYRFSIRSEPWRHPVEFQYINHTQEGRFDMHSLSCVGFSNSMDAEPSDGQCDTVTFAGFGIWSKGAHRSVQQVSVQICTNPRASYVGIQIEGANISNVNTKPHDEPDALP